MSHVHSQQLALCTVFPAQSWYFFLSKFSPREDLACKPKLCPYCLVRISNLPYFLLYKTQIILDKENKKKKLLQQSNNHKRGARQWRWR